MKFLISRASYKEPPCEGAVKEDILRKDIRNLPMKLIKGFMDYGFNHKNINGGCQREFKENKYVIELKSLEDIIKLTKSVGSLVIENNDTYSNLDGTIIIYDDYLE